MHKGIIGLVAALSIFSPLQSSAQVLESQQINPQSINAELLNRLSCTIDESRIVYQDGGLNAIEFSAQYVTAEEATLPLTVQIENENGKILYEKKGKTTLKAEVSGNNTGPNILVLPDGDTVSRISFPVHGSRVVSLKIIVGNVPCQTKKFNVLDTLACSLEGQVELLDADKNEVFVSLRYESPDARRMEENDIPYELQVAYGEDSIAMVSGNTSLQAGEQYVYLQEDSTVVSRKIYKQDNVDAITINGSLGGKTCTPTQLSYIDPPSELPTDLSTLVSGSLSEQLPSLYKRNTTDSTSSTVMADTGYQLSQTACAVIGEGVSDKNGDFFIATGIRYANLPEEQYTYQLIAYPRNSPESRRVLGGAIDGANHQAGFIPGDLFTFSPTANGDQFVILGIIDELLCTPAIFDAPEQASEDAVLVVERRDGKQIELTSQRIKPNNATPNDEAVVASENLLNELIEKEFDLQGIIDDAFAEDNTNSISFGELRMYIVAGSLASIVVLLTVIIIYMKKTLPTSNE